MSRFKWWMRVVGVFYLLMFVMTALVKLPIQVLGPAGTLEKAASGEPTAKLLVDTWMTLGLEFLSVGVALLIASRTPEKARVLGWTVIGIEILRGIGTDLYMILRGYEPTPQLVWILIHLIIITTGYHFLKKTR